MSMSIDEKLEQAYELLVKWESWTGEFEKSGCEDPDLTFTAHRLIGAITACQVLREHPRPMEYMEQLIQEAHELVQC